MSPSDTPFAGNRGRGGNFRPLVYRATDDTQLQSIIDGQAEAIGSAIIDALLSGQGVLFSPTRNLGAISVILYGPGDPEQSYASNRVELSECLQAIHARSTAQKAPAVPLPLNGRKTR